MTLPIGAVYRIHDREAGWDYGHIVTVIGHYQGWPIVRGSGEDRVINPDRLKPTQRKEKRDDGSAQGKLDL